MECEKFDIVMMVLIILLLVAVAAMYVVVMPYTFVLFGIAAQCASEDPWGRFAAFIIALIMSAFIGFNIANLLNECSCKEE